MSDELKPIEVMKCPFRVEKDGRFGDCYGDYCMAYLEYETRPLGYNYPKQNYIAGFLGDQIKVRQCKRMPITYQTYGGCV